jgi:hypothetical protein
VDRALASPVGVDVIGSRSKRSFELGTLGVLSELVKPGMAGEEDFDPNYPRGASSDIERPRQHQLWSCRGLVVCDEVGYFLVAQKISAIASISLSNLSATATSLVFLASPAVLVALQKSS